MRPLTALIIIGLVATASILGSAYVFQWFGGPLSCGSPTGNNPRAVRFTVVMTSFGYNDSYHHNPPPPYYDVTSPYIPQPWPTMNVTTGSNVFIQVLNNDTGQDHGFAIKHYFEQGVVLQPGQSCSLIFLASTSGTFPVYPPTLDRTYGDENAQLNVNP